MGTNCTSEPLRASTRLSPGFALPRPRSLGFWSHGCDSGPFQTPSLTGLAAGCGPVGFPAPPGLKPLRLATTVNSPARASRRKARPRSPPLVLPRRRGFLRGGSTLSSRATCRRPVSGSFNPPSGVLFSFPSRYLVRYRSRDVFSLGSRCLPASHGKTKPWYSGTPAIPLPGFRLRGCHPLWRSLPAHFGYPG